MNENKSLTQFEIVFFEDQSDNNQVGILIEEDYFDLSNKSVNIWYSYIDNNIMFFSEIRELLIENVSPTLISQIKDIVTIHLIFVDLDIAIRCFERN